MNRVALAEIDPALEAADQRGQSDSLVTTNVAINHYRIAPESGFPGGVHAHMNQEELFIIIAGTAAFETMNGTITVDAGEAIRFAPGEFHSGTNAANEELVALAVGAPRDTEDVRIPFACPGCDHPDLRMATDDGLTFVCPDCSRTQTPKTACPACGDGELRVTLDAESHPIVACSDCNATFESLPLDSK